MLLQRASIALPPSKLVSECMTSPPPPPSRAEGGGAGGRQAGSAKTGEATSRKLMIHEWRGKRKDSGGGRDSTLG